MAGDGFTTDTLAGPLWAEAGSELYEAWMQFYGGQDRVFAANHAR
jgi:hypothetical protein